MPTDSQIKIDKALLKDRILLLESLVQYCIVDNPIIENNPNLKQKSANISDLLLDLKNHI